MKEDERIWVVKEILFDYVKSPSLRHIRDPHSVVKLAQEIVRRIDRGTSIWRKWNDPRELLLKSALRCWVPMGDLRDFLNLIPGPQLTMSDVTQRFRAFEDEEREYGKDEFQAGCLAIYEKEKAEGTELPAIIQLLRDYVECEEDRLRTEQNESYLRRKEEERVAREQRLLSGADCKWTQHQKSVHWYCRMNGRTYRLSPSGDKRWDLYRVQSVSDHEKAPLLGKYGGRADATKAIAKIAYEPEPRW